MIVSKKQWEELNQKVDEVLLMQKQIMNGLFALSQAIQESNTQKEIQYFG